MSKSDAGKGDWYRPVNKEKYDKNYLRIFGVVCPQCNGKGYLEDFGVQKNEKIKTKCLICQGYGYVEKK